MDAEEISEEKSKRACFQVSFPLSVHWENESGETIVSPGITENIGRNGVLVILPGVLPMVGSNVRLVFSKNIKIPVTIEASVLRLERNASNPKAAFHLADSEKWEKHVWNYAGEVSKIIE